MPRNEPALSVHSCTRIILRMDHRIWPVIERSRENA